MMTITEKIIDWIEEEYNACIFYHSDPREVLTRAYGAMMFTINSILSYDSEESKIIRNWWDDEMLPKFKELERR